MAQVRARDGVCLYGLSTGDPCLHMLEVHHITFRSAGGRDTLDNLILLCGKHHRLAQTHRISANTLRQILASFQP